MAKLTKAKLKKVSEKTQGIFNILPREFRVSLAVIGGGLLAYKLYRKINPTEEDKAAKELAKEAKVTSEGTSCEDRLSYKPSQYKGFARQLYNAFKEAVGTDEDAIFSVMNKMKNECDLLQTIADFGVHRQDLTLSKYNLPQFMHDELNAKDIQTVNDILRKKGISYRF